MEEAVLLLKEENLQLNDYLREKKAALESDKSMEWSYKIEELQLDISEMVEKFKVEKDLLRDGFRKEELKRKDELASLTALLRKAKEDNEELRRTIARREAHFKDHDQTNDELRLAVKDRTEELAECREKMRIYMAEVEELESRLR
jgi:chromosome segregation ATPase